MSINIVNTPELQEFIRAVSGLTVPGGGARNKQILYRILSDLFRAIEDLDMTPDEFWAGVNYFNDLGASGEAALLAAGVGLEHYFDLRMDAADAAAQIAPGTPRTIEGPLYVAGAPMVNGFARLDDGTDPGRVLIMHGVVRDVDGTPIENAIVDVWHAGTKGTYSYFDQSQSEYNFRRRIRTDRNGCYKFRSIVPSGYGCPPDGPTQNLLDSIGRHGQRPAHIHFFISADNHRKLTTQINLAGDKYLHDDFAYATRDELIAELIPHSDTESIAREGLNDPYAEIKFDFTLSPIAAHKLDQGVERRRVLVS